jgi:tetratricopeptide (TPR) repeat protein
MNSLEEPNTGHLTPDELASLIGLNEPGVLPEERASHARSCDSCRRTIAMYQEENTRLHRLVGGSRQAPGAGCPPLSEWASLAAGLVEGRRTQELLTHASECDACGAALHAVVEDFSADLTEEESRALESLQSAKPDWQHEMARRMANISRGRPAQIRTWLARAAVVLIAVGGGWLAWSQWTAGAPARLIAKAYTQQRPFEFRIPGASYAVVRQERRGTGSSFQKPSALLEAEASVARELEKNPDDVKWLELRARVEALGREPEAAISTLQHALERKPDDPDLMADLGMAYALRAEASNRDVNYGYAIEYLERSLKVKPNSPVVVFNRAVVYERMFLYEDAIREWRHYVELDGSGPWKEEAQRRLAELEQKKKSEGQP